MESHLKRFPFHNPMNNPCHPWFLLQELCFDESSTNDMDGIGRTRLNSSTTIDRQCGRFGATAIGDFNRVMVVATSHMQLSTPWADKNTSASKLRQLQLCQCNFKTMSTSLMQLQASTLVNLNFKFELQF